MNLITRTISASLIGLSGLVFSTASQAESRFSISFFGGYPVYHATHSDNDRYRARDHHYQAPRHVDTYVTKHVYRDYRHHSNYGHNNDHYDRHQSRRDRHDRHNRHERKDRHERKHKKRNDRRHHAGYAPRRHH